MEDNVYQQVYMCFSYILVISLFLGFALSTSAEVFGVIGFLVFEISLIVLSFTAILQNLGFPTFAAVISLIALPFCLWWLAEKRSCDRKEKCKEKAKELFPEAPPKALKIVEEMIYDGSDVSNLLWDGDILISKDGENENILYSKSIARTPPKGKIYATEMTLIDDLIKEHGIALSETIKHYIAMMVRFGWDIGSSQLDGEFVSIGLSRGREAMIVKLPCQLSEPEITTQSAFPNPDASAKVEVSE